ncbi:MAG: hypothetical protein QM736_15270, partial [Vicinamibacterales bacterium]
MKSGGVTEVVVGDVAIAGTLKEPIANGTRQTTEFVTTRVEDAKLTEELEARGVRYSGETNNRWLPELLGWLVPMLFFVGIWGSFFRRMSGAEGGVMSFARSRAKVFADDEVKVRFADVAGVDEAREETARGGGVPEDSQGSTNIGGRIPEGVLLRRPSRHGQDAARAGRRRRSARALLQPERQVLRISCFPINLSNT